MMKEFSFMDNVCPECQNKFNSMLSLTIHWGRTHKRQGTELWLKLNNLEKEPTCACGCEGKVRFLDSGRGFRKYIRGHAARIKNNYNTEKSTANSIKKRREMLKDGTWKPWFEKETGEHWAKGKTKENCPSIMQAMITRETPEYKVIASERSRRPRLSGVKYGPAHSRWKGGTSYMYLGCQSKSRLYREWKLPILKAGNFQCSKCQHGKELQVHHDKVKFSEILHIIAKEYNWEESFLAALQNGLEELCNLKHRTSEAIVDYHVQNNVSGIVLCRACHGELHPSLNFKQSEELET